MPRFTQRFTVDTLTDALDRLLPGLDVYPAHKIRSTVTWTTVKFGTCTRDEVLSHYMTRQRDSWTDTYIVDTITEEGIFWLPDSTNEPTRDEELAMYRWCARNHVVPGFTSDSERASIQTFEQYLGDKVEIPEQHRWAFDEWAPQPWNVAEVE